MAYIMKQKSLEFKTEHLAKGSVLWWHTKLFILHKARIGDVKIIFRLQDVNLSVNNFWSFFQIWNKELTKNSNLPKTFFLDTFWTITLGVEKLLRNDLIHESIKFGG